MHGPLASNPENLVFYPEDKPYYDDFVHGDKVKRIYKALPTGTAALTSLLFFDSINRDAKGFSKGDGVILVGAFFTKKARESSLAKVSLGSIPPVHIAKPNVHLKAATEFIKSARNFFYASIYKAYVDFNATKGAKCELQNGLVMHFSKAIILAIYADQPAATKLSVTGSACPQCYTAKNIIGTPPAMRATTLTLRTPKGMVARRHTLQVKAGTIQYTHAT
jgi:hypothetical protein